MPHRALAAPPTIEATVSASRVETARDYAALYGERRAVAGLTRARGLDLRLAGVLGFGVLAMAAVGFREAVVRAAPPSSRFFAALGLPVNLRGVAIAGLAASVVEDGGARSLGVEGRLSNISARARSAGPLAVSVLGADGRALYAWTVPAPKPRLEVGESAPFRIRLASPPAGAQAIVVRFAESGGGSAQSMAVSR